VFRGFISRVLDRLRGKFGLGDRKEMDRRAGLSSGLLVLVADSEPLVRFIKSRNHYSPTKKAVKPAAFLPNPKDGKSSVFRHPCEPVEELWSIGSGELGQNVHIHGAGVIIARAARDEGLEVTASEPPPRHANIENWPTDGDPEIAKAARKEVAIVLAARAKLLLRDP